MKTFSSFLESSVFHGELEADDRSGRDFDALMSKRGKPRPVGFGMHVVKPRDLQSKPEVDIELPDMGSYSSDSGSHSSFSATNDKNMIKKAIERSRIKRQIDILKQRLMELE